MLAVSAEKDVMALAMAEKDKQLAQLTEDMIFFKDALATVALSVLCVYCILINVSCCAFVRTFACRARDRR